MNLTKTLLCTTLVILLPATSVFARGDHSNRIGHRIDRQEMRIDKGVQRGELTRFEERKLRKQNRRIKRLYRDFRSDGRLNRSERKKLLKKLARASDRIYTLKHNDRYRKVQHHRRGKHHRRHDRHHDRYDRIVYSEGGLTVYLSFADH